MPGWRLLPCPRLSNLLRGGVSLFAFWDVCGGVRDGGRGEVVMTSGRTIDGEVLEFVILLERRGGLLVCDGLLLGL